MDIMAKKREAILLLSLKRQAELEANRPQREEELAKQREEAALKKEEQERKKLEYKQRREAILEQYRYKKKATESMERDGGHNHHHPWQAAAATGGASSEKSSTNSGSQTNLSSSANSSSNNNHHEHNPYNQHPAQLSNSQEPSSRTMKSSQSSWSIYTGPKLFAKPTSKTNLITIQNAIVKALEGAANEKSLKRMQETISIHSATCSHFLILFRNRHQFRGLYQYEQKQQDTIKKLDGIGPKMVKKEDILRYYKFDTPKRLFIEVQTRDISLTIIAFSIKDHLWPNKPKITQSQSQPSTLPTPSKPPHENTLNNNTNNQNHNTSK